MTQTETKTNQTEPQAKRPLNWWKVAFFLLVGCLLGSGIFLASRLTQIREPQLADTPAIVATEGTPVISIQSNKKQVNALMDFFLEDLQKDSTVKYRFYLENEALLNGTFEVLGYPIQFYLYFDPYVMENGNVQLKAKSLSIGTLSLPVSDIMKFIKKEYTLPKWVEIDAENQTILLRLDQFRMQNGLFIRAEKINLIDDDIQMNIYLPEAEQKNTTEDE